MSGLSVVDMAVFGGVDAIAAIHHVATRELAASRIDVGERPPAVKVDVVARRAVHVDVQVARLVDLHVIESGIRRRGEAI